VNPYGHVDLRVTSMEESLPFYAMLLPALGFTRPFHGPVWKVFAAEGEFPSAPFFSLTEDRDHRPNKNRIAFWAASRGDVDRIGALLKQSGAKVTSGPQEFPEYRGSYYAVFFEDPSGNRLEVVHRTL
jgi:catechol 2,3-dioxygenase-like lactoylglutathione lyase family enzyme